MIAIKANDNLSRLLYLLRRFPDNRIRNWIIEFLIRIFVSTYRFDLLINFSYEWLNWTIIILHASSSGRNFTLSIIVETRGWSEIRPRESNFPQTKDTPSRTYPLNLPFFIVPYVLQSRTMRSFEKVEDKFSRSFPLSFTSNENLLSSTETTNGKTLSTLRLLDFAEFHDSRF